MKLERLGPANLGRKAMAQGQRLDSILMRCFAIMGWIATAVVLIGSVVIVLGIGMAINEFAGSQPPDQQMLDHFQTHKAEFNQLLQMFLADQKLDTVAYNHTRSKDLQPAGITPERLRAYNALLWKANLGLTIRPSLALYRYSMDGPTAVRLVVSSRGLAVSGSDKGYVYAPARPTLVVDNLDSYRSPDGKPFTAYRHIEGNWYLFYDYEP